MANSFDRFTVLISQMLQLGFVLLAQLDHAIVRRPLAVFMLLLLSFDSPKLLARHVGQCLLVFFVVV